MRRWIVASSVAVVAVALFAVLVTVLLVRGSLPTLEGQRRVAGLTAKVVVERDALGSASIHAKNRLDAVRALGFLHAQERFFEMDLMRRIPAGELAELVGQTALSSDRMNRSHRLRARLPSRLAALPEAQRAAVSAYTEGVNAGLHELSVRPWAYLVLRTHPAPWLQEDTLLVGLAMYFELQDPMNRRELGWAQLRHHLPPRLFDALRVPGSPWDAPMDGDPWSLPDVAPLTLELETAGAAGMVLHPERDVDGVTGSNAFAVAGSLTPDGRALVANDMHLALRAPSLWFRVRMSYDDPYAPGGHVDATGVSLPGVPMLLAGSNGHVAWGFTNSYGDWADWFEVEWLDANKTRYRIPGGEARAARFTEVLQVKGELPETIDVVETRWGPVLAASPEGKDLALKWQAHLPGALDFGWADIVRASDLEDAVAVARQAGMPVQNLVIGDRSGRVGWTFAGRIPQRLGRCDSSLPIPVNSSCDWSDEWLTDAEVPVGLDPRHGRVWSANSRMVDATELRWIGDGGYDFGARQRQIRDALHASEQFDEADLLRIQLDDRAPLMQQWWGILREVLERNSGDPELMALEEATRERPLRASVDSVSYRAARGFRTLTLDHLTAALLAPAQEAEGEVFVAPRLSQLEAVLVEPDALAPRTKMATHWEALFDASARSLAENWTQQPGEFEQRVWGEINVLEVCHPLADAMPGTLRHLLCMPAVPMPGDNNLPRVQGRGFGASHRMVVAPGKEHEGIFHLAGGQSGHPLSPFWGSGHADWQEGRSTPFLHSEALYRLNLVPNDAAAE